MKAIELFKELNYELIRNDDDWIIYSKTVENDVKKVVSFSDQLQNFNVSFEDTITRQVPSIDMELFNAIQQQLLELGWINK